MSGATGERFSVVTPNGRSFPAELVGSRVVGTSVFLHFRWKGRSGHVALLPDNTDADHLRVLRARLSAAR